MAGKPHRQRPGSTARVKPHSPQRQLPQPSQPIPLRVPRAAKHLEDSFQLLIDCGDEESQRALYEWLHAAGWPCRVLVM